MAALNTVDARSCVSQALAISGWKAPHRTPTPHFPSLVLSAYPYIWFRTNDGWFCEVLEVPKRPKLTSPTAGYTISVDAPPN